MVLNEISIAYTKMAINKEAPITTNAELNSSLEVGQLTLFTIS